MDILIGDKKTASYRSASEYDILTFESFAEKTSRTTPKFYALYCASYIVHQTLTSLDVTDKNGNFLFPFNTRFDGSMHIPLTYEEFSDIYIALRDEMPQLPNLLLKWALEANPQYNDVFKKYIPDKRTVG